MMNYKILLELLKGEISGVKFVEKAKKELQQYISHSTSIEKTSVPVFSNEEIEYIEEEDILSLFNLYLRNEIFEWELEFILSFLDLSYIGDNDRIESVICYLENPYLHSYISKANINAVIGFLNNQIDELNLESASIRDKQKEVNLRPNYRTLLH